jgi:YD repeat-containing protein
VAYRYDRIGQLNVADSSVSTEDTGYAYDAGWNLNYRTNFGGLNTYTVDSKNQLTSSPGGSPSYDANGNLTALGDGTFDTAGYDDENRLIWAQAEDFWRSEFAYDGLGRLRQRSEYDWDGYWKLIEQTTTFMMAGA